MSRFDLPTSTFLKHSSGGAGRLVLWPLSHDLATHRHSYAGEPVAALAAANVFCRDRPYRCGDRRCDVYPDEGTPTARTSGDLLLRVWECPGPTTQHIAGAGC